MADFVINSLEKPLFTKYNVSLKKLLSDPDQYAGDPKVGLRISNMREEVNRFIGDRLDDIKEEVKRLDDSAIKVNSISALIANGVASLSKQYKIPIIKPAGLNRVDDNDTTIFVASASQETMQLAERLVSISDYVIDMTAKYKEYNLGTWLFAGARNTSISVNFGPSPALTMYNTMQEIDSLMEAAIGQLKGQ